MKRYLFLLAGVVLAALGMAVFARMPHPQHASPAAQRARETVAWNVRVQGGRMEPDVLSASKGARAVLRVTNADARQHELRLLGYEDLVPAFKVEAGTTTEKTLDLDRPAEDLVLQVDGRLGARVAVLGSHLEEGHR